MQRKILVTGALGQIGCELMPVLRAEFGSHNVVALDVKEASAACQHQGPWEQADATDREAMRQILTKYQINTIYHLVGILSATGEKNPQLAWTVNMQSLMNILELAVELKADRLFWPSSIAVFGPLTPKRQTPQTAVAEPITMYGLTKVAGELLCRYYYLKYELDVRSLRYPGIISSKVWPGGGTTDYAVEMYRAAVAGDDYQCFVKAETVLPMMYIDDAIRAAVEIMEAPPEKIKIRTAYNLAAGSFSAQELAAAIAKHLPNFHCAFRPDARQHIADSWPHSLDDSCARRDWGWQARFTLEQITEAMIKNLKA